MEDSSRNVTIRALRPKTRSLICDLLKPIVFIRTTNTTPRRLRYWRGLAELCEIDPSYDSALLEEPNPTHKVLNLWYEKDPVDSTIEKLLSFLEEIDRGDVIDDTIDLIDEDIKVYRANPQTIAVKAPSLEADKYIITTEDFRRINEGLELETYDAFLLYDQDDIDFAIQLLEIMEKDYNMKFCVKDRDLVGGGLEMDKMITLITERCNRLVVILSDSFFKSSANDYLLKFAQAYGIESQRKIIPCVYKDLANHPHHIKYLFTLDYRRMRIFNFWEKLKDSIKVGDPEKIKVGRSKSDNGQLLRSVDSYKLKPSLHHGVKFSSSVGDLNNLDVISEPPQMNPSTSADNLEQYTETSKKEKKFNLFQKIKSFRKKKPVDCMEQEREKTKGFRKHFKRTAAVAN